MKQAFNDLGFKNVAEAKDGAAAWTMIEESLANGLPYGLIMSDWAMPIITGVQLLKKVRGEERTKDIPFIMVTAETETHLVKEAISSGVSNYVTKPFTLDMIRDKVESVHKAVLKKAAGNKA